eukprot:TRINITY_DN14304_c0_g1_i1.p1 TRINITY_DN14304_c0_g1~~TRINITY_DN14304_c0_g1_i1.p1  ORF type:complete len:271 (+),score=30.45 TRINITY_DN14304_c0_g1_i1:54-866(+)
MLSRMRSTLPKGPLTFPSTEKKASVACILRGNEDLEMLFIKRASRDSDKWSGQIAFPGGRWEENDKNVRETAEREVLEELGLDLSKGFEYVGRAKDFTAQTNFSVSVCLYRQTCDITPTMTVREDEVALAGWVSTSNIIDPKNITYFSIPQLSSTLQFQGINITIKDITTPVGAATPPPPYVLWGLTQRMTTNILSHMTDEFKPPIPYRFTGPFGRAKTSLFSGILSTCDSLGYHPTYNMLLSIQYLLLFGGFTLAGMTGAAIYGCRSKL